MDGDEVGIVIRAVANRGTCNKDQIKHALATQMRNRSGHVPSHQILDAMIDRALSTSRVYADRDGNYRAAD